MSKENLEQFIQQISDSEELQTRIGDEIDADAFIALGAEHGCEFTAEDLTEHAELSDEELEGVAGGVVTGGSTTRVAGWRVNADGLLKWRSKGSVGNASDGGNFDIPIP